MDKGVGKMEWLFGLYGQWIKIEGIRPFLFCLALGLLSYAIHYQLVQSVDLKVHVDLLGFRLGIDNLSSAVLQLIAPAGKSSYTVGLVTNQSGVSGTRRSTLAILQEHNVVVKKIFLPEHGMLADMHIPSDILVESLCDQNKHKQLEASSFSGIDVLMFDIQDVGMRHYSYVTTLRNIIEAAGKYKKTVVVFDRPNLLGSSMEGICTDEPCESSLAIPLRYGMTIGELAQYLNLYCVQAPARLFVVPMDQYYRTVPVSSLAASLSPNIRSLDSCYGYSFLGLIGEVAPFDIGIGTQKAFQCILLPESVQLSKSKWYELKVMLKRIGIESSFYSYFSARKKEQCFGLYLRIKSVDAFSSFHTLIMILRFFKTNGVVLRFSKHFDEVVASSTIRELVEGKVSFEMVEQVVNKSLKLFFNKARSCFIYKPIPKVIFL